jgi:hypothetical protein
MRKWFVCLGLACGLSAALVQIGAAQVKIQVQAQQRIQIQAQPQVQIQVQPGNVGQLALRVAMPGPGFGGGARMMDADAIFAGRVVAFEPMDVKASQTPGGPKVNYRVAIVQVSEVIHGLKKGTQTVRVAFVTQGNNGIGGVPGNVQILPAVQPAIQPNLSGFGRRPYIGNAQITLQMDQDGLFTVSKHPQEKFFLSPAYNGFVGRQNNANFDTEVKNAKQLAKVLGDPVAALKAQDKQDRYVAAAVLLTRYRTPSNPTGRAMKEEPINAAESQLILKALTDGDWTAGRFNAAVPNPYELFNRLGVSQRDGYNPINIRTQQDIAKAMQKWIEDNNGKFVIKKLVVDPNAKVQPGIIDRPEIRPGVIRPGIRPLPPVRIQPGKIQIQPLPAPVPDQAPPGQADRDDAPQQAPAQRAQPKRRQ